MPHIDSAAPIPAFPCCCCCCSCSLHLVADADAAEELHEATFEEVLAVLQDCASRWEIFGASQLTGEQMQWLRQQPACPCVAHPCV